MAIFSVFMHRLRVLIIARLLIGACLLFYAQFVFPIEEIVFYSIIGLISVLSIVYVFWLISGFRLVQLAWIQIASDLILESILIYYTGGVDSLFGSVYVLSILSAGLVLSPGSSFYVAAGSSLYFIATVILVQRRWCPSFMTLIAKPNFPQLRESIYLFYASYVQVTVFFLVAILTYYFSRIIQRLEHKIKAQERLVYLGEVASNIAHEIRNPLVSISTATEVLAKQLHEQLNEKQKQLMNAVVDESLRISRIFNGILNFARISKFEFEEIDLESFLDEVLLLFQHHEAFNPKVQMRSLYKGKRVKIKADPEQIKEACMNLITNAYEAMPEGGVITLDCQKNRDVKIIITDSGKGVDPKILSQPFIPFQTTKINGTGLGLAQANKIVCQHGGRIEIKNVTGNKGAQVCISLPNQSS